MIGRRGSCKMFQRRMMVFEALSSERGPSYISCCVNYAPIELEDARVRYRPVYGKVTYSRVDGAHLLNCIGILKARPAAS